MNACSPVARNNRVLVIDDNRAIHDDFRKILSDQDPLRAAEAKLFGKTEGVAFQLDFAQQGEEGLGLVQQALAQGSPYAMAFVDVRMPPGWDGIETTRRIWEVDPDLQIVICTAYSDYSWDEMSEVLGQPDRLLILKKPFDTIEVVQLAHALTDKWRLLQESKRTVADLERAVAERTAELRHVGERLRVALEGSRLAMWDWNIASGAVHLSDQWSKMLGGSLLATETSLDAFGASVHPEDAAAFRESVRAATQLDSGFDAEYRVCHQSGEWLWMRSRGQVVERARDGQALRAIGTSVDISDDKVKLELMLQVNRDMRALSEANAVAAAVIRNAEEGVMVIDAALQIESVNPAFERITGYPALEAVGCKPSILSSGRHEDAFFHRMQARLGAESSWQGEIWNRRRSGEIYPQQTSIGVLRGKVGEITHYATVFRDLTLEHQAQARLQELATIDGLTGIANRRSFDEILTREWAHARREGRPLSLLMTDIDHFKGYNDLNGHPGGDGCLQEVAKAIAGTVKRAGDLAARYGGEEFAVILPNTDAQAAARIAEKIRAGVAALAVPHGASDAAAFVTVSIGVATLIPLEALQAVELISAADRALYRAKHEGRNCVVSAIQDEPADAATVPREAIRVRAGSDVSTAIKVLDGKA